ncbi:MAG: 30S ribosomal protein S12 methylthiotransferase RimO [Actinobacteria bacterium]|nr:30S ribosomal protein S12 methylthiotransferase RimO [Actinomycetota bacterium]
MARVAIVTLGCPKNSVDSEGLAGLLSTRGHEVITDTATAEVVVVNTCGFIEPARRETVEEVLDLADLKDTTGLAGLVLAGCLVARSASELAEALPEVDAFVDFAAYPRIGEIVTDAAAGELSSRIHGEPGTRFDPAWWDATIAAGPRLRFGRAPWAYVKIAEGCNRGCTFCSIPLMRGRLKSRSPDIIEAEARGLVAQGVAELSLVSQDSVMWGRDSGDGDLLELLGRLEAIEGLRRLRLMYLHPQGVTDRLIDRMTSSDVIVSYFDLSLQHVAPEVLRNMGRWGSAGRFTRMIEGIRAQDPLAGVRATFILGFPGETEAQADQVEAFVAETEIDWIGTFTYSPEDGTRSVLMPDRVAEAAARARTERVASAAEVTMERRARWLVGQRLEILAESFDRAQGTWLGRSHREAPEIDGEVRFTGATGVSVGDLVEVRITGNAGADLEGVGAGVATDPRQGDEGMLAATSIPV